MSANNSTDATIESTSHTHLTTINLEQTWTIDSFSSYVDVDGSNLHSGTFSLVHGYPNFRLLLYPNGDGKKYPNHVSLYIECTGKPTIELPVKYQFSIIDKDGQHRNTSGPIEHTFTRKHSLGLQDFIARTDLLNSDNGLLPSDQLTIYCKISATYKKSTSGLSGRSYDELEKLSYNLKKVFENGDYSDVIFCVGGIDIPAHKVILSAASTVFASMFKQKDTKEAQEGKVIIEDVDVDTFKVLLKYLYCRQIPDQSQLTEELLAASDKYLVYDLKLACEDYLSTTLTINSASTMFLFADTHNAFTLKANCFHYILANAIEVLETEDWMALLKAQPELANKIIYSSALKLRELVQLRRRLQSAQIDDSFDG